MKKNKQLLALLLVGLAAIASAQESSDPFAKTSAEDEDSDPFTDDSSSNVESEKMISLCYETFSLPLADAAAIRREEISDALLYQKLVDGLKKNSVKQETFTITRLRSGERAQCIQCH